MTLEQFSAVVSGYTQRNLDLQEVGVHFGFWAGYYGGMGKRKKTPATVIERIRKARHNKSGRSAPDVDVEAFLERERRFQEAYKRSGGDAVVR